MSQASILFPCAAPIKGALNVRAAPLRSAGTTIFVFFIHVPAERKNQPERSDRLY